MIASLYFDGSGEILADSREASRQLVVLQPAKATLTTSANSKRIDPDQAHTFLMILVSTNRHSPELFVKATF
jgi:hypothetical protein